MDKLNIIVVTDSASWFVPYAEKLVAKFSSLGHRVTLAYGFDELNSYDLCFLLSYGKIVPLEKLKLNKHNLVVHESALPQGKGWSPLTWQILEGKDEIPITLFEADAAVDAGDIYLADAMYFRGDELVDELRAVQGSATISICTRFVQGYPAILAQAVRQTGEESFYPRRRPQDSRLAIDKNIRENFNLLRVCDNERYPAYFEYRGARYTLKIYRQ